jgi:hypothetical protein
VSGVGVVVLELFGVVLGIAAVVAGGYDDSPGLQGLGLVLALGCLWLLVRAGLRARGAGARGSSR